MPIPQSFTGTAHIHRPATPAGTEIQSTVHPTTPPPQPHQASTSGSQEEAHETLRLSQPDATVPTPANASLSSVEGHERSDPHSDAPGPNGQGGKPEADKKNLSLGERWKALSTPKKIAIVATLGLVLFFMTTKAGGSTPPSTPPPSN